VSIERTYYCDGPENADIPGDGDQPDGCPKNVTAAMLDGAYLPGGFVEVRSHVQGATYQELHFCGWDCLLRYAAQQRPTEYLTLDDLGGPT
jgi:hypothetical protein